MTVATFRPLRNCPITTAIPLTGCLWAKQFPKACTS
jgi:hypothetical protein